MTMPGHACCGEALSTLRDTREAMRESLERVGETVGSNPDLALVFLTPEHLEDPEAVVRDVLHILGPDVWIGCGASGVIADGVEQQYGPAVAAWAARLPGARVQGFHLELVDEGEERYVRGWPQIGSEASACLLADVYTFPVEPFLHSLRRSGHAPPLIGGLASGATPPDGNVLFLDGEVHRGGAVGFALGGSMRIQPLVSQGCRPVGPRFKVTRSERNVIYELDGEAAFTGLHQVANSLTEAEKQQFVRAPQIGIQRSSGPPDESDTGGFLIRGLMGADPNAGTVLVGDHMSEGLTIQFHTRDGDSAGTEFEEMLGLASSLHPDPCGALLFDCSGRGVNLFEEAHHDVGLVHRYFPDLALAGMFAAGEIGPVHGQPHVHGFTASMGILVPNDGT